MRILFWSPMAVAPPAMARASATVTVGSTGKSPGLLGRQLNIHTQYVVIYYENAYTQMPLVTFSRELLEMEAEARAKALVKVRQLEQSFLTPLENLRAPP